MERRRRRCERVVSRTPHRSCAVGRRELLGQGQLRLGKIELMCYSKWTYDDKYDAKSVYPLNNDVRVILNGTWQRTERRTFRSALRDTVRIGRDDFLEM